jgi:DNA-binding transcriptional MerR regulator
LITRSSAVSRQGRESSTGALSPAHQLPFGAEDEAITRVNRIHAIAAVSIGYRRRRDGGGSEAGGGASGESQRGLLSDADLRLIEDAYPSGLTAAQIVDVFVSRGVRFSEASFRKYVQQGLLPRSRRVGRKGKHRGSLGVYPAKTLRRINAVKQLMLDGYTIEEIQEQFLQYADAIETIEENVADIAQRLEAEIQAPRFDAAARKSVGREVAEVRKAAADLVRRLDELSRRVAPPRTDRAGGSGAAGAEDLL